jgi:hypothetical protein
MRMLRCSACGNEKPEVEFYVNNWNARGRGYRCKPCQSEYNIRWQQGNRKERASYMRRFNKTASGKACLKVRRLKKYDLSDGEFAELVEAQGGKCWICKAPGGEALCVDHNHKTGKVRGLLCQDCNRMLGCARDNVDVLNKAIDYLKEKDHAMLYL